MADVPPPAEERAPSGPTGRTRFARLLRPEGVYLALALAFGGAFLVLTPPYQVPDEPAHFRRAFQLSEGRVVSVKQGNCTGDDQPRALDALEQRYARFFLRHEEKTTAAEIRDGASVRLDPDDRAFAPFSNTAIHPPLTYLPQALGVFLARKLSGSVLVCLYAGRLFNLLAAAAVTFFAIRRTPAGKWALAALALTPMSLSLAASLSSDALTNALAFLLVAQVLALAVGPAERVGGRSVAATALLAGAVGLAKQAYFLLPLCYLMIPARKFGSRSRYWAGLGVVLAVPLAVVWGWGQVVTDIYSPSDAKFGMNPAEQWRLMRHDPGEFLLVLLRTGRFTPVYVEGFVGWLGFGDLRLPVWVYVADLSLLVAVCAAEFGPRSGVAAWQALVAAAVAALVTLTVLVVMHLTWDAVGAPNISVQGRHLIPVAPLVALAAGRLLGGLAPGLLSRALRAVPLAVALAVPVVLAASLTRLHGRFFEDSSQAAAQRCYTRGVALAQEAGAGARAREQFEEALRLDPGHVASRFDLANLLARQGDYTAAIRRYEEALRLSPGDANVHNRLREALAAQEAAARVARQIPPALDALARSEGLAEERHPRTPRAGLYLKPNRGRAVDAAGRSPFPAAFLWRCPPPAGGECRITGLPAAAGNGRDSPFYACSAEPVVGTRRAYVFPPPTGAVFLADEEVSWYYQRPLAALTEARRERETAYRRERGLRFPLAAPPD